MKHLIAALLLCTTTNAAIADPLFSLDQMQSHPYRFVPPFGHTWQNPGSPRYFRPGYGYVIPAPSFNASFTQPWASQDLFESRGDNETARPSRSPFGTSPWFLPGYSSGTMPNWPGF